MCVCLALMIAICDCFVMAVNCSWAKGKIILPYGVLDSRDKRFNHAFFWLSVCAYFLYSFLNVLCPSCCSSAVRVLYESCAVHDSLDQTMNKEKEQKNLPMYQASLRLQSTVEIMLSQHERKIATALFRVSISACSKRIHWNIILFVKCFT